MGRPNTPKYNVEFMWKSSNLHTDIKFNTDIKRSQRDYGLNAELTAEYMRPRIDQTPYKVTITQKTSAQRTEDTRKVRMNL